MDKRIFKDKKAGEKLLSFWWFLVIAIVGGAIVIAVITYHGAEVNVKEAEAGILYDKISGCIINQGFLREEVLNEGFDIFQECGLSRKVIENSGEFYFKISISNKAGEELREDIKKGEVSLEQDCYIQREIEAKKYPGCVEGKTGILYYQDREVKEGILEILTVSNQNGEKILIE